MENDVVNTGPIRELRQFDKARRQAVSRLFQDIPLQDPAQHFLLICIHRHSREGKDPGQRDLVRLTERSPATVTASLKVLERLELIRRYPDENDQRVNRVALTEKGSALAEECQRRMLSLESHMFRGFSADELGQLSAIFGKIIRNLADPVISEKEVTSVD